MGFKRTKEEIENIVVNLGFTFIDSYFSKVNKNTKVIIKDNIGYKYDVQLSSVMNPNLGIRYVDKSNPYSLENIKTWIHNNNKKFTLLSNEYLGTKELLALECLVPTCKEIFYMSWSDISGNHGCPYCSGNKAGSHNNFAYLFPDLLTEWDYEKNVILPEQIVKFYQGTVFWKCSTCKYEWSTKGLSTRTYMLSGCPACAGKVVTDKNRLSILYPEIALEWHPSKNADLTSYDVSYGSHKKVWWLCPEGHEYYSSIAHRVNGCDCPTCYEENQESFLATELKSYCKTKYNSVSEYKIIKNPNTKRWLKYDIYIPKKKIFIEVHGVQHYENNKFFFKTNKEFEYHKKLDMFKKEYAEENGIYIEIDLRKIKTLNEAVIFIESNINKALTK